MKYAIALALVAGVTSVSASPYYVGKNLTPKNHVSIGFNDTLTKETAPNGTGERGNLVAVDLNAAYNVLPNVPVTAALPYYYANKNAAGTSRAALGNASLGLGWNNSFTSQDQAWTYGYALTLDAYFPSSRKTEAANFVLANPATELFRYTSKATSALPTLGLFASWNQLSAKVNAGFGYSYIQGSGVTDRNRTNIPLQVAGSWHALPYLHLNGEYNAIIMDTKTAGTGKKFRHGLSPSISGNYDAFIASAYATVPIDTTTRDLHNVSFGINAGYTF